MITDLPSQIFSTPTEPQSAIITRYTPNPAINCIQNPESKCRQKQPETGDFGGHFTVSTTANGTASGTTQNMSQFIPWEYLNPSQLTQFDYEAHLSEIRSEIRVK